MGKGGLVCFVLYLASNTGLSLCLEIDGCPLYGCRPSGSFSFYLNVPRTNASIRWQTPFVMDPVPDPLGCSANSVSIVCQSNGPFSNNKGYVSLDHDNGTVRWRDGVLYFPTLPILDNYGDVTGSDGVSLVHFDANGKNYPIIPCQDMKPIFSMQLVGTMYLLMVSQLGGLSVRDTNAIPVAEIFLNDTIQRTNGTFLPISQPVVNGQRFYLLTEFVPNSDNADKHEGEILNLQRLYAIDIHDRMADIMTVAWFYNFEMEHDGKRSAGTFHRPSPGFTKSAPNIDANKYLKRRLEDSITGTQVLLWDRSSKVVNVILPPPYASNSITTFWGLRDAGNDTTLAYRTDLHVTHMAKFEPNDDVKNPTDRLSQPSVLWASMADGRICSLAAGNITRCIDLGKLLGSTVIITSKIALVRKKDSDNDTLVLGVKLPTPPIQLSSDIHSKVRNGNNNTCYVVALDTVPEFGNLLWLVPVPGNLEVRGQITGSSGADYREKDQLVVFANTAGMSAKVFTIY